jgi:5-formyltetrahydrofolate cyclo-ligase
LKRRWRESRKWSCPLRNNVEFSKDILRKRLRSERLTIDVATREAAALAAAALLVAHPLFLNHQRFAAYIAHGGEFDVAPVIQQIWQARKQCYLPVLSIETPGLLQFVAYEPDTVLETNRYHILEPEFSLANEVAAADLDVVLVPLTAFNRDGIRVGSGGGFYDKTFAFLRENKLAKPLLMGVGFGLQEMAELPHDEWDVKLNGVLTERELVVFG